MSNLRRFSLPVLIAMLFTLTVVFLFDDVLFYLLFERVLGFEINLFGRSVVIALLTLLNLWLALLVMKSASASPQTGSEGMLGATGTVKSVAPPFYWVMVRGELWRARSDENLAVGDSVIVRDLQGLTLHVTREHKNVNGGNA
jgi:membrane protein implicated in regulation of membrane protease activity